MRNLIVFSFSFLLFSIFFGCASKSDIKVSSPDGLINARLMYDKEQGIISYSVQSSGDEIIAPGRLGLLTGKGDFSSGMKLKKRSSRTIDETYVLPQGKVSTYLNHANELILNLMTDGGEMNILFRVYNDGVAFCYEIPGEGDIEITEEISTIQLAGQNFTYYGQNHPNRYGYESALGPIEGNRMSNPVLAHIKDLSHYVLMGQAATNGNYIQPHFSRSGSAFTYSFPLDQEKVGPVVASLPFKDRKSTRLNSSHT